MGHFDNIIIRAKTAETAGTQVGTIYQDLPEKGFLSALMVDLACKVQWSTTPGLDIWNIFTKFEVLVDGSKVVKSYDAKQLRAIAHNSGMDLSSLGTYERQNVTKDQNYWKFPILFGRYPGDLEYMLDMERYSNPQLRITYDASQTLVDGKTYAAPTDPTIRSGVQGLIVRSGAPKNLKGYIKSTEIDNWSCVPATTRQTEIPRGNKLIGYMQGARYAMHLMNTYIESTELTFDNGEWQLYDHVASEIESLDALLNPRPVKIRFYKDLSTDQPIDTCLGICTQFGGNTAIVGVEQLSLVASGEFNIQNTSIIGFADAGLAGAVATEVFMSGQFPHQNIYFPLHKYGEEGEFGIDTTKYGRIDIKTTTGGAADTAANLQTVAEYVVPTGE